MGKSGAEKEYDKLYSDIGFDRTDLFRFINETYGDREVLYLGSSIHIAPSFVFTNVTYVDKSELFKRFSKNKTEIQNLIEERKVYRSKAHVNLVVRDYSSSNNIEGRKYGLVLALFSPETYKLAAEYIENDGIFIYLPLPSDTERNKYPDLYQKVGEIVFQKGKYGFKSGTYKEKHGEQMVGDKFKESNVYLVLKKRN